MLLTPNMQVNKITDITIDILRENNIQAMILDVDNTLIDLDREPLDGVKEWIDEMKQDGINFCIASNSLKKHKIEKIFLYFSFHNRPLSFSPFVIFYGLFLYICFRTTRYSSPFR